MTSNGLNGWLLEVKELGNIKDEENKYVLVLFEVRKKNIFKYTYFIYEQDNRVKLLP